MRNKSVLDAAKGVYPCIRGYSGVKRCGGSHLNDSRSNPHHPEHRKTTQTHFLPQPPTTRNYTAQHAPHLHTPPRLTTHRTYGIICVLTAKGNSSAYSTERQHDIIN